MIELKQFEEALQKCVDNVKVFEDEHVEFKVRARILQRKGTIHTHLKQYAEAVQAYQDSLHESKTDVVKDLLIEAKQKFKEWEIIKNTDPELSDKKNREANQLYKEKKFPEALKV